MRALVVAQGAPQISQIPALERPGIGRHAETVHEDHGEPGVRRPLLLDI
jgi:hypothetical protein